MTLESEFIKKFSQDVYMVQSTTFLGNDKEFIMQLMDKQDLSHDEEILLCCIFSAVVYDYAIDIFTLKLDHYKLYKKPNGLVYGIFFSLKNDFYTVIIVLKKQQLHTTNNMIQSLFRVRLYE